MYGIDAKFSGESDFNHPRAPKPTQKVKIFKICFFLGLMYGIDAKFYGESDFDHPRARKPL